MSSPDRNGTAGTFAGPLRPYNSANNSVELPVSGTYQRPLGVSLSAVSPGTTVGHTWVDGQQLGSMGRMITWSLHGSPDTMIVHFSWMYLPGAVWFGREYRYYSYNAVTGSFQTETGLQSLDDNGGFVGIDVCGDGRAVVGGHNREGADGVVDCHFYWDTGPGLANFSAQAQVPDHISSYGGTPGREVMWPKFRYQEGPGDTVLHVLAVESGLGDFEPAVLYYFRKVGAGAGGTWDDPPYIVDTVYTPAHDIAADGSGRVALVWTANLPCAGDPCDTCSGWECRDYPQMDNDLYCQISSDYGITWQPRRNVTGNIAGESSYRIFANISALMTSDGNLHVVWDERIWPLEFGKGQLPGSLRGRLCHWSETDDHVSTVHSFNWDQTECNGGAWQLQASKMSLSECDNNLHVLLVQFNDIPHGVADDCAVGSSPGFPDGAANGDLYLTISSDGGLTWDEARNLTNSRTPGCDSTGGSGGPCANEQWPSMTRQGSDYVGDFSTTEIIVPAGSSDPGSYYLDVQYIYDPSAGAVAQQEGWWAHAEVRWFRLACVAPLAQPRLILEPEEIAYPSWSGHGNQADRSVVVSNPGNATLSYNIVVQEDTGPSGWLAHSGFSGSVSYGLSHTDTGLVSLNTGGLVNDPGTTVHLVGRLIFQSNAATSPDTLEISHLVVDTLIEPVWDTISTACTRLIVSNTGNFGRQGFGKHNLDYYFSGDCDTTATIYVYDGSPVIGYLTGGNDTIVNYSMFNVTCDDPRGLVPLGDTATADSGRYRMFQTGKFVTHDSLIAMEKTWYAPQHSDTCSFIVECLTIYLNDTLKVPPTSVRIGEAVDFDIPSDTGSRNHSGFDSAHRLVYLQGAEYDGLGCQLNDSRYGGISFLGAYQNGSLYDSLPHGAYTRDNPSDVYPTGSFPVDSLFKYMANSGYAVSDSTGVDLYAVMVFDTLPTLTAADTFQFFYGILTQENGMLSDFLDEVDKMRYWYGHPVEPSCCDLRGDFDNTGDIDVGDLTSLIGYLFQGGAPPPCTDEGDADANGGIDVGDLTYLVAYLFQGGLPPPPC